MKYEKKPKLKAGEVVTHVLHGPLWMGIVMLSDYDIQRSKIHMIPGSEFEFFFKRLVYKCEEKSRIGWVYNWWLIKS